MGRLGSRYRSGSGRRTAGSAEEGVGVEVPGRVLVGEGVLVKMCRKRPKPRQFYLFNDILVYGSILIAKKRFNKQHVVPLEDIHLEDIEDEGDLRNGWLIKSRSKSFAVYAASALEKKEWVVHINRCIQDLLAKSPLAFSSLLLPAQRRAGGCEVERSKERTTRRCGCRTRTRRCACSARRAASGSSTAATTAATAGPSSAGPALPSGATCQAQPCSPSSRVA